MKIQSTKKSWKKRTAIALSALLVVLVIVSSLAYVYVFNGDILGWNNNDPSVNLDKPTDEQVKSGIAIKNESLKKDSINSDKTTDPSGQTDGSKKGVDISITAANQNDNILQIRGLVYAVDDGLCTLTLSRDGQTVTKTAGTQAQASVSSCKGFDVPVSELSNGTWQMTLTYENEIMKGSVSQPVTIQ